MKRRTVIGSGGLWVLTPTAFAQSARKVPRIGVIVTATASGNAGPQPESLPIKSLLRGLGELGYV